MHSGQSGDADADHPADQYRGERVRLAGHLQSAGVERWAGLWMRVEVNDDLPAEPRNLDFERHR